MRWSVSCAIACALLSAAATVRAQTEFTGRHHVAIIGLEWRGNVTEGAREILTTRLRAGLAAAAFDVSASVGSQSCNVASCCPSLAQSLNVGCLVVGKVEKERKTYETTVEVVKGRTGSS